MMGNYASRSRAIAKELFWEKHNRESYVCPDCRRAEDELLRPFEVHHMNGEPLDNRLGNLIGLCRLCHELREGKKPNIELIRHLRNSYRGPGGAPAVFVESTIVDDSARMAGGENAGTTPRDEPSALQADGGEEHSGSGELINGVRGPMRVGERPRELFKILQDKSNGVVSTTQAHELATEYGSDQLDVSRRSVGNYLSVLVDVGVLRVDKSNKSNWFKVL